MGANLAHARTGADGSDGLTVELWLRVDGVGASTEEQPIFSIGAPDATSDNGLDNIGLRLSAAREDLLVDMIFRGQSPYDDDVGTEWFSRKMPDVIGDVAGGNVSHIVVSIGQRIDVFVDGTLYDDKNFLADYDYEDFLATEAWADTFALELFSDGISRYEGAEPFEGDIFSLRIYDRKLDAAEAAQNFAVGLPQTPALEAEEAGLVLLAAPTIERRRGTRGVLVARGGRERGAPGSPAGHGPQALRHGPPTFCAGSELATRGRERRARQGPADP